VLPKLLKFKEWLTIPDTARHLSIIFDAEVAEADVLRLALDGHLTLSVNFVNSVRATCGPLESREAATQIFDGANNTKLEVTRGQEIRKGEFWQRGGKIVYICGVWDLTLLGLERDDVEHRYQCMTGGPYLENTTAEGPFLSREDGTMCQLLDVFADSADYSLPSDGVLVVRTSALRELEARVWEPDKPPERPIGQRERTTLLLMIAALAKLARIDVSKPSSAAAAIESQTALMGARVAARTIENHMNRIPEALESRQED
jgi:hypothetical protein